MASTVKRYFAGFLAFWFAVFSVVFPVAANAAVYNATPTFTGRAWYVPAAGPLTSLGPVASIAVGLGRLNPWITAGMVGSSIYRFVVETQSAGSIGIVSDGQLFTPIPGWSNSNSPPATATGSTSTTEATLIPAGTSIPALRQYYAQALPSQKFDTVVAACDNVVKPYPACGHTVIGWMGSGSQAGTCKGTVSGTCQTLDYAYGSYECAAGYTLSGSNCISQANTYSCPAGHK